MSLTTRRLLHTSTGLRARTHSHKSHYDVLEVSSTSSKREIKNKFYELSKKAHPDTGGDRNHFEQLTEAYSILGDDSKRRQYDMSIKPTRSSEGPSSSFSPHSPYLRNHRTGRTGPHRAWANAGSSPYGQSSTQSRPREAWMDYGFAERTGGATGGRRGGPPPQFGSASHHMYRYPYSEGGRPGQAHKIHAEDEKGGAEVRQESSMMRFLGVVALLLTVIGLGGGFTAKADEKTLDEKQCDDMDPSP